MDASSDTIPDADAPDSATAASSPSNGKGGEADAGTNAEGAPNAEARTEIKPHAQTKALAAVDPIPGVDVFTAPPEAKADLPPRGLKTRMLDYSAHAAMIVGLLGFAWTVGDHVVNRPSAHVAAPASIASSSVPSSSGASPTVGTVASPRVAPKAGDELADLRNENRELAGSVRSLQKRLDALQATVAGDKASARIGVLQAGLDDVKSGLAASRSDTAHAVAQLNGRVDEMGREPTRKVQQLADRLGRLEQSMDLAPTASLPRHGADKAAERKVADARSEEPKTANATDSKGAKAKVAAVEEGRRPDPEAVAPKVLTGWVVRDVYDGVALLEGRRGPLEVVPGVSIPGAGIVKSIDRHGNGWTVTTTKGLVAFASAREIRRGGSREPMRNFGYDF